MKNIRFVTLFLLASEIILLLTVKYLGVYPKYLLDIATLLGILLFIFIPLTVYISVVNRGDPFLKGVTFGVSSLYLISFFGMWMSYFSRSSGIEGIPDLLASQFSLTFAGSDDLIFFIVLVSSWVLSLLFGWVFANTKTLVNIMKVSIPVSIIFGVISFSERYFRLHDNPDYITYFWESGEALSPVITVVIPSLLLTVIGYFILRKFSKFQNWQ